MLTDSFIFHEVDDIKILKYLTSIKSKSTGSDSIKIEFKPIPESFKDLRPLRYQRYQDFLEKNLLISLEVIWTIKIFYNVHNLVFGQALAIPPALN